MSGMVNYVQPEFGVFPLTTSKRKGIRIRYCCKKNGCGIIIYDKKTGAEYGRYFFEKTDSESNVYELILREYALDKISYHFLEGNKRVIDRRALMYSGSDSFGTIKKLSDFRAISLSHSYDWEGDKLPALSYEECIGYCMHVRGFTMHKSSKVRAKGTFKGITEKIPYLKDLGITTLELQPAYEFVESAISPEESPKEKYTGKLNYWGYKEAFYYVPKRAYTYGKDASTEFKDMVKALHQNGMELIMQFYFPDSVLRMDILPILRYWHTEYHVDGFHIKGNNIPMQDIAQDAYLSNAKIWSNTFSDETTKSNGINDGKRFAVYNDYFMCVMRGFLKADKEMLKPAMDCMISNPAEHGLIKYLTNYYGFTMADMVRYQKKQNLANGEENRDGTDYNCTWNCGVEGNTRKQNILDLRTQQIKNALALLFLSQGTPLIFMGDEFANSQKGNNNPYCQDNDISWLNWSDLEKNRNLYEYLKCLIRMRKEIKILSHNKQYVLTDYQSIGYPELSFHDEEAWKYSWDTEYNHIGLMINGDYVSGCEETYWYIAINTHWEVHSFVLPSLEHKKWRLYFKTNDAFSEQDLILDDKDTIAKLSSRCICIFVAE